MPVLAMQFVPSYIPMYITMHIRYTNLCVHMYVYINNCCIILLSNFNSFLFSLLRREKRACSFTFLQVPRWILIGLIAIIQQSRRKNLQSASCHMLVRDPNLHSDTEQRLESSLQDLMKHFFTRTGNKGKSINF
jgi:hypothetical protein